MNIRTQLEEYMKVGLLDPKKVADRLLEYLDEETLEDIAIHDHWIPEEDIWDGLEEETARKEYDPDDDDYLDSIPSKYDPDED